MNQTLDLSIPKRRLALLSASFAASLLLLYSAGILTGMMVDPRRLKNSRQEIQGNLLPVHAKNSPSGISSPIVRESKATAIPPAVKPGAEPDFGPAPLQLAVQVASFTDRIRAQSFADSLKRQGFPSLSVGATKIAEQTWYLVRLGPYTDWDTASRAAAQIQHSYNVQTYVRRL